MESDEDQRTVWCGNISDRVSEEILYELFLQAAPIQRVKIPRDRDGRQLSYGFITFKHDCSVPYVIQLLNGTLLFDRRINLKPRNSNQNSNKIENHNVYQANLNVQPNAHMQVGMHMLVGENLHEMQNAYGQMNRSPLARNSYRNESRREDLKPYRQPNNHYNRHNRNNHFGSSSHDKGRKHRRH